MRSTVILLLLFVPGLIFAAGGLVPCDGPDCNACSLVSLGQNILNWLIIFTIVVSGVVFAIAGLRMVMSAGNEGEVTKAKGMFTNVIVGLVILLSAWLIIDTIMKLPNFVDQSKLGPWNEIQCAGAVAAVPSGAVPTGVVPAAPSGVAGVTQARTTLANNNIAVNKAECPTGATYQSVAGGCTSVGGLQQATLNSLTAMKLECGSNCDFVVTGGSELGHVGGTAPGTHGGGDKFDLRTTQTINNYVNGSSFESTTYNNRSGRANTEAGVFCVIEDAGTSNEHWDCLRTS